MAELVMFCGLPCSGKTTNAKLLEAQGAYVRLCTDEWKADLNVDPFDDSFGMLLEQSLWRHALRLLQLGQDVILENGLWSAGERDYVRRMGQAMGASVTMVYLPTPLDELKRRVRGRNASAGHGEVPLTDDDLDKYWAMFQAPTDDELSRYDRLLLGGLTG